MSGAPQTKREADEVRTDKIFYSNANFLSSHPVSIR